MGTFDASQALRYAMDQPLGIPSILGVAEYGVYVIKIVNDQVAFDDVDTNRVVTKTRITVGQNFLPFAARDGYLNPCIMQENGEQLILSNGFLTANKLLLGPLVFPYFWNNFSGGIDAGLFQPAKLNNKNVQVHVQITGDALSPKGNFYDVEMIAIDNMGSLSYNVVLRANEEVVI